MCIAICGMKYEYEKCLLNKSIQKGNSILYMGYITKRMNICFLELYGRLRSWAWFLLTVSSLKEGALLLLLLLSRFSCVRLCNCRDGSPPGSAVPGILQARTLEWVAISFSNAGNWKVKVTSLSRSWLLETPWTAAHQAPPSMGFSRQEYWSGVPLWTPHTP